MNACKMINLGLKNVNLLSQMMNLKFLKLYLHRHCDSVYQSNQHLDVIDVKSLSLLPHSLSKTLILVTVI